MQFVQTEHKRTKQKALTYEHLTNNTETDCDINRSNKTPHRMVRVRFRVNRTGRPVQSFVKPIWI